MRARWLWVALTVLSVSAVSGVVAWWSYEPGGPLSPRSTGPPGSVDVLQVSWQEFAYPANYTPGFNVTGGTSVALSGRNLFSCLPLVEEDGTPSPINCTLETVWIDSPGFGLVSSNTPIELWSGMYGTNATVNVTVSTPYNGYSGDLNLGLDFGGWLV